MKLNVTANRLGSALLEVVVALAIFVGAGSAILSATSRGERFLAAALAEEQAADLARSAISAVEVGIATPQSVGTLVTEDGGATWRVAGSLPNAEGNGASLYFFDENAGRVRDLAHHDQSSCDRCEAICGDRSHLRRALCAQRFAGSSFDTVRFGHRLYAERPFVLRIPRARCD